ncbi:helix-turn-helix domain-containing protein [Streptomyces sp. NPDC059785]|uniref:helix-turn-helix domain-containing protein n=1 Tax=Streptomyces sp. NPDC059785 TaxID=3346945 RepID=UPI003655B0B3
MAEQKLIPASCPRQGVRRTAARSGVTHVRTYQPDRYSIIGNHLAQHRQLSLTAIGLAVHILSLPDGAASDIRTLAAHFPEGRDRIAFALRELEGAGYIERVRERVADGRVITRTYAHEVPGEPGRPGRPVVAAVAVATTAVPAAPVASPAAAVPATPAAPAEPEPPARDPAPDAVEPAPPRSEHHDEAEALLIGLRRTDDRFTLSRRDVRHLVPAAVAWFENGASRTAVQHALTADIPAHLRHPKRFLAYRLAALLPPPVPFLPEKAIEVMRPQAEPPPWYPLVICAGGCTRPFRAPEGTWCRDCRARRDESRD